VDHAEEATIEVLASLSVDLGRRHGAVEPLDDPGWGEAIHALRIDADLDLRVRALLNKERDPEALAGMVHQLPGSLPGAAPVAADEDKVNGVRDEPGLVIAKAGEKQLPDVGIDLPSHPADQGGRPGLEVGIGAV